MNYVIERNHRYFAMEHKYFHGEGRFCWTIDPKKAAKYTDKELGQAELICKTYVGAKIVEAKE